MSVAVEIVRYRYTDVRCPSCRQWRSFLVIDANGDLRCESCPRHPNQPRPRRQSPGGAGSSRRTHHNNRRSTMTTDFGFIPGFSDEYGDAVASIESAGQRAAERIADQQAALLRPDGTPKLAPQEHQERETAILEAATAEYDRVTARHKQAAESTVTEARRRLTLLGGADPLDALNDAERQAAAARREFIREDVLGMAPGALAARIRAVTAQGDKVAAALIERYLKDRTSGSTPDLMAASRELQSFLGLDNQIQKEIEIEAERRRADALIATVESVRRTVDGRDARMVAGLRRSFSI